MAKTMTFLLLSLQLLQSIPLLTQEHPESEKFWLSGGKCCCSVLQQKVIFFFSPQEILYHAKV